MRPMTLSIALACLAMAGVAAGDVDILLLVPHRYGANYNYTRDRFESYGWTATTAAVTEVVEPCNPGLPDLVVDTLITGIDDVTAFDAVAIMPATWRYQEDPYGDLIGCPEAIALLQAAVAEGMPVWSTCVGPRVLAAADLLDGVTMQGEPGADGEYRAEYLAAGAVYLGTGLPPVIDGAVITATRDQYFQSENCEAVGTVLASSMGLDAASGGSLIESIPCSVDGTVWAVTFGGAGADGGRSVCPTDDGGYMLTGYTWSAGAGESDVLLVMTDGNGVMTWSSAVGGPGFDCGNSVCSLEGGGYAVAGSTTSSGSGGQDLLLMRLDGSGGVLWSRTYGGTGLEAGMSVCEAPGGGLVACGYTESSGSGQNDIYLVRTDPSGDVIWERTYGGSGPETGDCVIPGPDGGFVVAGSTGSYTTNRDAFLLRVDAEGDLIWSDYYGAPGGEFHDYGRSVVECPDGGLPVCGTTKDSESNRTTSRGTPEETPCRGGVSFGSIARPGDIGDRVPDVGWLAQGREAGW